METFSSKNSAAFLPVGWGSDAAVSLHRREEVEERGSQVLLEQERARCSTAGGG